MLTIFILYYVVGLVLSSTLLFLAYRVLGIGGFHNTLTEEYPDTSRFSAKECFIYFAIVVMTLLPICYGGMIVYYVYKRVKNENIRML